tara:strand:- start:1280 stop:1525 length:246 start_codon:yes stop_codon:yes gene_type:complete
MNWDNFFKVAGLVSTLIVIPTFGWVWQTNTKVQAIKIELEHTNEQVDEMKTNSVDIQLLKKDIEYIKTNLDDVKRLLKKRN